MDRSERRKAVANGQRVGKMQRPKTKDDDDDDGDENNLQDSTIIMTTAAACYHTARLVPSYTRACRTRSDLALADDCERKACPVLVLDARRHFEVDQSARADVAVMIAFLSMSHSYA